MEQLPEPSPAEPSEKTTIETTAQFVAANLFGRQLDSQELEDVFRGVALTIEGSRQEQREQMTRSLNGSSERQESKLTPPELARRWGISPDKVHAWIRSGELKAIDMSTKRGGRPRYLIDANDIDSFETRRAVLPPLPETRKRKTQPEGIIEYF